MKRFLLAAVLIALTASCGETEGARQRRARNCYDAYLGCEQDAEGYCEGASDFDVCVAMRMGDCARAYEECYERC